MKISFPTVLKSFGRTKYSLTFLLFWLTVIGVLQVRAQTPFQDASGNSSILLTDGAFVQINIADPSIRLGYVRDLANHKWTLGFDVSGKLTGTKATLLNRNHVAPDMKVGFTFGRKYLLANRLDLDRLNLKDPTDKKKLEDIREKAVANGLAPNADVGEYWKALPYDRLSLQIGYAFKQFKLLDEAAAFDKQVIKKNFHNPSAALVYSIQLSGYSLLGASVGVGRNNNSGDLTEVDVRDINSSTFGDTVRELVRTRAVLRGDFKQSTSTFLNTDYVIYPRKAFSRVGFNFYTRSVFTGLEKGIHPGFGFFISEKGAPTKVLGGASFSYDQGRLTVALVAGFNFN